MAYELGLLLIRDIPNVSASRRSAVRLVRAVVRCHACDATSKTKVKLSSLTSSVYGTV